MWCCGDSPGDEAREAWGRGLIMQRVSRLLGSCFIHISTFMQFPLLHPQISGTQRIANKSGACVLRAACQRPPTSSAAPSLSSCLSFPTEKLLIFFPPNIHLSRNRYMKLKRGAIISLHLFLFSPLPGPERGPCALGSADHH